MNEDFLLALDDADDYVEAPAPSPSYINKWEPSLVLDLAMRLEPLENILLRHNLKYEVYEKLIDNRHFRLELAKTIKDLHDNGVTFSAKAKVQAEAYLQTIDELVTDEATPPSTRLEAIKSVVRWGKLEPQKEEGQQQATQVNVNIQF